MGNIKHALSYSFYHLLRFDPKISDTDGTHFESSLLSTIENGGDTDTNACIVGKMIGALVGKKGIPKKWLDKILSFDCTKAGMNGKKGRRRPEFLSVKKHAITNIQALIESRPEASESFAFNIKL